MLITMKNLFKIAMFAAGTFIVSPAFAQTHKDSTIGHKISKTAKNVGHKTSQIAANGASAVVDKKYEGKVAPGNHTVYINEHDKYYYVNKKGHRVYIKKSQLIDKPEK